MNYNKPYRIDWKAEARRELVNKLKVGVIEAVRFIALLGILTTIYLWAIILN
jgi:hypothetical protein